MYIYTLVPDTIFIQIKYTHLDVALFTYKLFIWEILLRNDFHLYINHSLTKCITLAIDIIILCSRNYIYKLAKKSKKTKHGFVVYFWRMCRFTVPEMG